MMSLLQQKTLTAGVAVSKSLSMRKMARGDWSPLTDASNDDPRRYGERRRDALMWRRRGGEGGGWEGGGARGVGS